MSGEGIDELLTILGESGLTRPAGAMSFSASFVLHSVLKTLTVGSYDGAVL